MILIAALAVSLLSLILRPVRMCPASNGSCPRAPFLWVPIQIYIMRAFVSALASDYRVILAKKIYLILLMNLSASGMSGQNPTSLYICTRLTEMRVFLLQLFDCIRKWSDRADAYCFY